MLSCYFLMNTREMSFLDILWTLGLYCHDTCRPRACRPAYLFALDWGWINDWKRKLFTSEKKWINRIFSWTKEMLAVAISCQRKQFWLIFFSAVIVTEVPTQNVKQRPFIKCCAARNPEKVQRVHAPWEFWWKKKIEGKGSSQLTSGLPLLWMRVRREICEAAPVRSQPINVAQVPKKLISGGGGGGGTPSLFFLPQKC